jgi:XTP/dITP diphosphohydrolase
MRLLIATTNKNKLLEIRRVLARPEVELLSLDDVPAIDEPDESAMSYWENARLKAFAYARAITPQSTHRDVMVVAEDSGLEISGLDGAPGVHSARFIGPNVPYPDRFAEIFRRLEGMPPHARAARFVTALVAVRGEEVVFETQAAIDGVIGQHAAGAHGFGYDPIFYYPPLQKTTAELTLDEKCMVSHRARAFRDFARWLRHPELA